MKLSIIIPVFGVETTLARCIDSVVSQSYTDYELILVDDGSPDSSGAICDEYASRHECIRVIHQPNHGLSSARNTGLSVSKGEYVTFIDSDDYIGPNTLSVLMTRLTAHPDYDILEYPIYWHYGSPDGTVLRFGTREYQDMRSYWLDCKAYTHTYAWNKIYVRHLFDDVRFPENRLFEDAYTLPQLLRHAKTVTTTEEGLYYYINNEKGITNNPGDRGLCDLLDAHLIQLRDLQLTDQLTEYFCHILNIQIDTYTSCGDQPKLPVPPISAKAIRSLHVGIKMRIKLWLLKLLGIKNLCKLHKLAYPRKRSR